MASSLAFFTIFSLLLVGYAIGGRKEPGEYWRDASKDELNSHTITKLGSVEARKYPEEDRRINLPAWRETEKAIFEKSYPVEASPYDSTVNDQTSIFSVATEIKNSKEEAKDNPVVGKDATIFNDEEKKASHSVFNDEESIVENKSTFDFNPTDATIYHGNSLVGKKFSLGFDPADATIYHADSLVEKKSSFGFNPTDATIYHGDSPVGKKSALSFGLDPTDMTIYHGDSLVRKKPSFGFDPADATIYHEDSLAEKKPLFDFDPADATIYHEDSLVGKKPSFSFDPSYVTIYHQ